MVEKEVIVKQFYSLPTVPWAVKKKLLKVLPELFTPGETIKMACKGMVFGVDQLCAITDQRLIFFHQSWVWGKKQFIIPLNAIKHVSCRNNGLHGEFILETDEMTQRIGWIQLNQMKLLEDVLASLLPQQEGEDVLDRLERLAALKDQGAITEEEFQRQKQHLLK